MKYLAVKNWEQFQHYKDRNPLWIKLHLGLLDDLDFLSLSETAQLQLIMIWMLAARLDNRIPADARFIAGKIGTRSRVRLQELIDAGYLIEVDEATPRTRADWPSRYVSAEMREAVFERDGRKCLGCGTTENLEIDHKIPVSKGGSGTKENLQTLCRTCNRRKRSRSVDMEQPATQTLRSGVASRASAPSRETETETEQHQQQQRAPAHADRFTGDGKAAYLGYRRAHPDPVAFDRAVAGIAEPLGGNGFGWDVLGQALADMAGNGSTWNVAWARGCCRTIKTPAPDRKQPRDRESKETRSNRMAAEILADRQRRQRESA